MGQGVMRRLFLVRTLARTPSRVAAEMTARRSSGNDRGRSKRWVVVVRRAE